MGHSLADAIIAMQLLHFDDTFMRVRDSNLLTVRHPVAISHQTRQPSPWAPKHHGSCVCIILFLHYGFKQAKTCGAACTRRPLAALGLSSTSPNDLP